ncbi:MAG: hypothetical protein ACI9TY_001355 [Alphaproteobacteria bacterium]|jgi:hypothetical protein
MKKVLLTKIPSADDHKNHAEALKQILLDNEKANFDAEVAEIRDLCARYIIMGIITDDKPLEIPLQANDKVKAIIKNELNSQGFIIKDCKIYDGFTSSSATGRKEQRTDGISISYRHKDELFIPTPYEFKQGVKFQNVPINIVEPSRQDILLNRCFKEIEKAKKGATRVVIRRNDMDNNSVDVVASLFEAQQWHVRSKSKLFSAYSYYS